jgi:hypothetical protein
MHGLVQENIRVNRKVHLVPASLDSDSVLTLTRGST